MSARLRHFIAVVLAILALSWAATAAAHHMPPVIFGDTGRLTLGADVDLLADPEGRLDLAGARAAYAARRSSTSGPRRRAWASVRAPCGCASP